MEALRDALPNAIFFTTPLDSRLAHPDEWRWTRNLLVGSPFGLTLREEYQDVPPFRESDQTAFYTATLLAAGNPARAEFLKKQRCVVSRASLRNRPQGGVRFDSSLSNPKTLQPENFDMERWWNPRREILTLAIGLFAMAAIAWSLRVILGHPNPKQKPEATNMPEPVPIELFRSRVGLLVEHVRDPGALFRGFGLGDQLLQRFRRRTIFLERWN